MSVEKKYNLDQMKNDMDLVKYLYTQVISQNIHKKVGKIRRDLNNIIIIETKNVNILYKNKKKLNCFTGLLC